MRGGDPDVVELQNFKKLKDLLAEHFENFWENVVLRMIWRTSVFGKHIVDIPPPVVTLTDDVVELNARTPRKFYCKMQIV